LAESTKARAFECGPILRAKPKAFPGLSDKLTWNILPFESPAKSAQEADVGGITTDSGRNHNWVTGTRAVIDMNTNLPLVETLTLALLGGGQLPREH
jgi:hypothetical protein